MNTDMCVPCDDGIINIRVGAIIMKNGRILMVRNGRADYCYSVGGRIKFGETAEDAVKREVFEETGVRMDVERLGFIHENYFTGDSPYNLGKTIYELAFYFFMNVPADFEPKCDSITEDGQEEYLEWVDPVEKGTIYPGFFRTLLNDPDSGVKHIVCDERIDIRKMREDDLIPLHELLSDPDVMKYIEPPYTLEQTRSFIKSCGLIDDPLVWIAEDHDHGFLGYVIYHDYDESSKEIGWVLRKELWGNRIAERLTLMLISKAASEGKRSVIECVPEQTATKKIALKCGFKKERTEDGLDVYMREV